MLIVEQPSPLACVAHNIFGETPADSLRKYRIGYTGFREGWIRSQPELLCRAI